MESDIVEYEGTSFAVYPHILHWDKFFPMKQEYQYECMTPMPIPLDPFVDWLESEPNIIVRARHDVDDLVRLFIIKKNGNWLLRTGAGIAVVLTPNIEGVPTLINLLASSEECKPRFVKTIHSPFN